MGPNVSQLCPDDDSYNMIHKYVASIFIDPKTLGEKAPVQFANGANNFAGLDARVTSMFDPTGLQLADPSRTRLSADRDPRLFGRPVPAHDQVPPGLLRRHRCGGDPGQPAPAKGQQTFGLVVVLGHDFALRFLAGK